MVTGDELLAAIAGLEEQQRVGSGRAGASVAPATSADFHASMATAIYGPHCGEDTAAFERYVEAVAAAGNREYPLPMFVNAWAVHSNKSGPRRISLPGRFDVTDLMAGRTVGDALSEIRFDLRGPGTRVFRLMPARRS